MRSKTWGLLTTACVVVGGLGVVLAQVSQDDPVSKDGEIVPAAAEPLDIGIVLPMPVDANFRPYLVGSGEVSGAAALGSTGTIVYSNRLGKNIYAPGGPPGALVGDDITTVGSAGCMLDAMRFRVTGDPLRDGSGIGGFSVTFALYSGCLSAGGFPLFPVVTETFPDNGDYDLSWSPAECQGGTEAGNYCTNDVDCPGSVCLPIDIEIPTNAYFVLSFSRSLAAIVSGGLATVGFSADSFDFPGARCDAGFGSFPGQPHGSFDLEITSRNDCPEGVCSSSCSGGGNAGAFCVRDDCPGGTCTPDIACLGGTNNTNACTTDSDCPNMCSGGGNSGDACTTVADCPSVCRGGANGGTACANDAACPGSTCWIGFCPEATCTRDKCVGGSNGDGFCTVDDCPSGSCDGPKRCNGGTSADQTCVYDCLSSFPAYKNTNQGGVFFTSLPGSEFFADDIKLSIPVDENNPCRLISWEVGFKGGPQGNGAIQAALHTFLDPDDPENGGRISGTKVVDIITGSNLKILTKTFAEPILITQQDLRVVFKTQNSFVGAIRTCKQAAPGSTQNVYFEHDGNSWETKVFEGTDECFSAFEVTLSCAGAPPSGACCDMTLTDARTCIGGPRDGLECSRNTQCRVCIGGSNDGSGCDQEVDCPGGSCPPERATFCIGDAVCRNLPEMNCAFPTLWREGESCGPACEGGARDGESCLTRFDCPSACVGGGDDGQPCSSDPECRGVCEPASGSFAGNPCFLDTDCRPNQFSTFLCIDHGTCGNTGACRGQFCFGGPNHGAPCSRSIDCPSTPTDSGECGSSCIDGDNDGLPCLQGIHCPGGFCPGIPFPEPCGLGTCCTSNNQRCCVTERACHTEGTPCGVFDVPIETPVDFRVGQSCDQGTCPPGACIGRTGDCTQARDGLCVGGTLNGEVCIPGLPCFPGQDDCCVQGGVCGLEPGCESPTCCARVCGVDDRCCSVHWSQTCANIASEACSRKPANNECYDPSPEKGALFVSVPDSVEVFLKDAEGGPSQPGLCCFRSTPPNPPDDPGNPGGPGSLAKATVWLKTIARPSGTCRGQSETGSDDGAPCTANGDCTSRKCRTNLSVDTCFTSGGGGEDSIIQVFSVGDKDSGLCEDGSFCKVSLQDCFDQSACVLDEEVVCRSLSPIGCSDDAFIENSFCVNSAQREFPFNSRLCVDVVPGEPYYIMVAAKDDAAKEKYRVTISSLCTPDPPVLFNDICSDAEQIGGDIDVFGCDGAGNCDKSFDLSGFGGIFARSTFDCPGSSCLNTMEHDVWYDWTAPATGRVSAETCDGAATPDTSLILYDGCDCPVEFNSELACSETEVTADCFLGSRVTAAVTGGQCYKFRLGGNFSRFPAGFPSGTLNIDFDECPPGPISLFDPLHDPPNQTIDARAPLDPRTQTPLGIDSFTVKWPSGTGGTTDKSCYTYCETFIDGFDPNTIFGLITDNGDDTFTVKLARPMAPGAFGTLTVKYGDDSTSQLFALSLPGDADASGSANPADLQFLVDALNAQVPFDKYRHDMDHSGALTPRDLLRWIDVTSGVPGAFSPWLNAPFPACAPCCP